MNHRLSISKLFVVILFFSLFVMAVRTVQDADFWWHLRTGQWIVENHRIPHTDPFSFTFQGKPWTAHEWLTEASFYLLFKAGGLTLLAILASAMVTASFALVYFRSENRPYLAGFSTLLGAIATAPIWGVRPQMVTILFFSLFLFLLNKYFESQQVKWIIPLPVVMILWVNMHAGYLIGLVAIAFILISKWIETRFPVFQQEGNDTSQIHPRSFLYAMGILVVCIVVVGLNPNGYGILVYPFGTITSKAMMTFIQEWFSPDFQLREWLPLAALIFLLLGSGLFSRKRSSLTDIALVLVFGFAALRSMRNVPFFAIAAIPALSFQLGGIVHVKVNQKETSAKQSLINWALLGMVLFGSLVQVTLSLQPQAMNQKRIFPQESAQWILDNHPKGQIFNAYGWGGYLIWKLYPDYQVYVDGRADLYGDKFLGDFLEVYNALPGWSETFRANGISIAVVEVDSPIYYALEDSSDWTCAVQNDHEALFIKKE